MAKHLHLDLVGGLAGDMFIGAMLDTFPELAATLDEVIRAAGFPELVDLEFAPHNDGVLTGSRFTVKATQQETDKHHHRHFSEIRQTLNASSLKEPVRDIALAIFHAIAEVEAEIHGKTVAEVAFHEVGAWDSIADVVLAAYLIDACGASSYSVSAVPMGRGFVQTAHGRLPVPAPATARLLEGFRVIDDGIEGERVTPTGAAILAYLAPVEVIPRGLVLQKTGYGFGTKVFKGLSNTVRVSVFETSIRAADAASDWDEDQLTKLAFELDDQTPESIAVAMSRIREAAGVVDVITQPVWGKKQRQAISVSVLVHSDHTTEAVRVCFATTTTLGIRRETVTRSILRRHQVNVRVRGQEFSVKVAERPGGLTAKVEMDDLQAWSGNHAEVDELRRAAEQVAIQEIQDRQ